MPLTEKGSEILSNMKKEYGVEKGESVFYASRNAGAISGVDAIAAHTGKVTDAVLNWGSGNYNVTPGGAGDPASMPSGASRATGMGGVSTEEKP